MEYVFKNTERNQQAASTYETKSLLYLLSKNRGKEGVEYLVVDCFNDISGIDSNFSKVWDVQSKNHKILNPKKIGESFYTLFSNYTSKLPICELILFVPPLDEKYKIDSKVVYNSSNFKSKELKKIENGLREEATRRKLVFSDKDIEDFLAKVIITEDHSSESDYVKEITKFKDKDFKTDDFYASIFKELRDIQSAKKNICIENEKISEIRDVLVFKKHFVSKDIEVLIMNRIIGCELFSFKSIPRKFLAFIKDISTQEVEDMLDECNANLSRAFFNKNDNKSFWKVCEKIISHISGKGDLDINDVFDSVFLEDKKRPRYLDDKTIQYLIAIILDQ